MKTKTWMAAAMLAGLAGVAHALDMDALKVQRKEVFEFTKKPKVARQGDRVTITFAVKDFCDATVAIEDTDGRTLRHLASGVLGANAPEPFDKNAKRQILVWDGKDDIGRYVDDKDRLTVRVSLGLKARFERTLYWSPHQTLSGSYARMAAAPEGVYVYAPGATEQLRLFDHQGNYVRTIYPFPAAKLAAVKGLKWQTYPPDNVRLPSKLSNHDQDTFLPEESTRAIAVRGDRICLAGSRVVFLATDGSSGGMDLAGPTVGYEAKGGDVGSEPWFRPHSIALSPDGKRLYLTAHGRRWSHYGYGQRTFLHGVDVVTLDGTPERKSFAGVMKSGKAAVGEDNQHFKCPQGVAVDAQGRVYVADNLNNRIQVFKPDGTFVKSIPTPRPSIVHVDPKSGAIWVTSGNISHGYHDMEAIGVEPGKIDGVRPVLRVLNSFDDPKETAAYPLDVPGNDYYRLFSVYDVNVEVDFATDPPTVWTAVAPDARGNPWQRCAIRLWQPADRKLVLKRDFSADARKALADPRAPHFNRPRLYVNPAGGQLYVGLISWGTAVACKSFYQVVRIDPATGANRIEQMPTDAEDLGFDWEGHAYLRTYNAITRCDPNTWKEMPYDYGDERMVYHGQGGGGERPFHAAGAVTIPSVIGGMFHMGGFGVSPQGNTVVSCINPEDPVQKNLMREKRVGATSLVRPYRPVVYPGRNMGYETHIYDVYGRSLFKDVTPGIGVSTMLQIDRDNNVYLLASSTPHLDGKPYFNGRGCTLIKFKPGKMKVLSAGGPVPLRPEDRPDRPVDMTRPGLWVEGAEWLFGPVGADGHYGSGGKCSCYVNGRFALDYYARSFAPEVDRFRVVVLDTNGNVIMRIGHYGNIEDGMPLIKKGGPPTNRSVGGDEVANMHVMNLAVHTDRRLFLADVGNTCIRSVKLGYHATEVVRLRDAKGGG